MAVDTWEPIDFLAEFRGRSKLCAEIIDLLRERAQSEAGHLWAHHLPRMVDQLDFFRRLLQDEIDHYGEWRYHGFQADEVLDFIEEDLDELGSWICRMTGTVASREAL